MVLIEFLIFIKKLIFILKKLVFGHRIKNMQSYNKSEKFRYYNSFFFFFYYKNNFSFSFYTLLFQSFILNILLLYMTNTNSFFFSINSKDFANKLSSENIIRRFLKLASINKNSY